ncbi:hypothetical protein HPP92_002589, partial [Vanilla planifolia]
CQLSNVSTTIMLCVASDLFVSKANDIVDYPCFIYEYVSQVAADKKNSTERANPTEQASSGNSSKKEPKPASLLRPMRNRVDGSVICICNDLYALALRPIRQIAKVHIFMQPSISRVVNSTSSDSLGSLHFFFKNKDDLGQFPFVQKL